MTDSNDQFLKAREEFAAWYDSMPEDVQFMIDEISDRTHSIVNESDYDQFRLKLCEIDIVEVEQFEDRFCKEYDGTVTEVEQEFLQEMQQQRGLPEPPPASHYTSFEFNGHTFFFIAQE